MSESNKVTVSYVEEVTWGITPNSAFQAIPFVSGAFPSGTETTRSKTIRDDAQKADMKRVGLAPKANYAFEFAAGQYDVFLKHAIRSDADWSTAVNLSSSAVTFASSGNTISATGIGTNATKGQWVHVLGAAQAGNNAWWKITAVASGSITVSGGTLTDESPGAAVTVKGQQMTNGSTKYSSSLQQQYTDLTDRYHLMVGARVNSFGLEQTPGGIITGTVAFDGKNRTQAAAKAGNGTVTAATTKEVVTEVDGFESVWIDGAVISDDVMRLSMAIATPNRPLKALGSLPRTSMGQGSPEFTGAMEFLLADATWAYETDLVNFTAFSLAYSIVLGSDYYLFEFPQVHFTDEPMTNGGVDTDLMLSFAWGAEPGGSFGTGSAEKTIMVCKVVA